MTALKLLERCVGPHGFLAALESRDNYRRVWARDGCICALAALASGRQVLVDAVRPTLATLAIHQAPAGQIPSNVGAGEVSHGGSAGRIDATLWWLLLISLDARLRADDVFLREHWDRVQRAAQVLRAWEHNDRALLYVPVAGDWADEYLLSGYLLYDNALYLWAARELWQSAERLRRDVDVGREPDEIAEALRRFEDADGFSAGFHAAARHEVFDAFGNALCGWLDVGPASLRRSAVARAASLSLYDLVPAFWPPIQPSDARWPMLERAAAGKLRNAPGRYHNGGLWPVVTGFWALAARRLGDAALADRWQRGITRANAAHDFPEYLDAGDGSPGGVRGLAWSAAAELLASRQAYERLTSAG